MFISCHKNYQDETMDEQQYHDDITDQEPVQPVNLIPAKQQMSSHHQYKSGRSICIWNIIDIPIRNLTTNHLQNNI